MTDWRVLKINRNSTSSRSTSQPGPVFDAAMRGVIEGDLLTATRLLGIPVTTATGVPEVLPASFGYPVGTLHADLVLEVGPARLAHVEYQGRDLADIVIRMLGYRWVIMRKYPTAVLSQYVVILGRGRVKPHVDPVMRRFWRVVSAIFLRDLDPVIFLEGASLAPLAVLGRGSPQERAQTFVRACKVIAHGGGSRTTELLEFAFVLARIRLAPITIQKILQEAGMTVESVAGEIVIGTAWGKNLLRTTREEGWVGGKEEGWVGGKEEGRVEGREEGREWALTELLRHRFGLHPDIPAIVHRLMTWPEGSAMPAAITASTLDELANAQPS